MLVNEFMMGEKKIAELISDEVLIDNPQDALDMMVEAGAEWIVIHDHNMNHDFFDLSTGFAGETLLKFTNYRVRLAVIGDFTRYSSKTLPDFIRESNRTGDFLFVENMAQVEDAWG